MPAELLPCPFCGDPPRLGKSHGKYYIQCTSHGIEPYGYVQLYGISKYDAAERWNRRADIKDVVTTGVQQLKAEIAEICTVIDVAESGLVTVDYAALKRRLRQLSAI